MNWPKRTSKRPGQDTTPCCDKKKRPNRSIPKPANAVQAPKPISSGRRPTWRWPTKPVVYRCHRTYDGYTGRRTLEPGQFVQGGQTLSYLVRGNDKWVTANYKETQIAHIYIGQKVRIKVDAFSGRTFHGTVTAISEATGSKYSLVPTDNSAGNFVKVQQRIPVRIDLNDASPEEMECLRAGMMVETEAVRP